MGTLLVACGFLFLARRVLVSVDWTLLLVFMAMFGGLHLLIQLPVLQNVLHSVSGLVPTRLMADSDWSLAGYQQRAVHHLTA